MNVLYGGMTPARWKAVGIDYGQGLERFSGKTVLYEHFLRVFPDDAAFAALGKAMEVRDGHGAFSAAHRLKGSAGNLSLTALYEELKPLVEALRMETPDWQEAERLWQSTDACYRKTCAFLRAWAAAH